MSSNGLLAALSAVSSRLTALALACKLRLDGFSPTKRPIESSDMTEEAGSATLEKEEDPQDALRAAVSAASNEYDADIYVYSGGIEDEGFGKLVQSVSRQKNRDRAILILTTNGGSANVGYQIARFFQKQYDEFIVCAPSFCKSAGTLIALGANKLIVDSFSDLGPLDVQLFKQNEIGARKSGLLSKSSFEAMGDAAFGLYERLMLGILLSSQGLVSFKLASELGATMASNMLAPVYGQINPDVVGSENRDLNVAMLYGLRLVETGRNASQSSVMRLVHDYPSHDFIIDDDEIRDLFKNVEYPSDTLYEVLGLINELTYAEAEPTVVLGLGPTPNEIRGEHDAVPSNSKGRKQTRSRAEPSMDENRPGNRRGNSKSPAQNTGSKANEADPSIEPARDADAGQFGNGQAGTP